MFGIAPKSQKPPLRFVVAYRIDDDVTRSLVQQSVASGFAPEQIARYALKKYLAEISNREG